MARPIPIPYHNLYTRLLHYNCKARKIIPFSGMKYSMGSGTRSGIRYQSIEDIFEVPCTAELCAVTDNRENILDKLQLVLIA